MEEVADYADFLLGEARSGIAAFHEFRLLYDPSKEEWHLFFEGDEDSLFYMPHVRSRVEQARVHPYVCDGKRRVLEVRRFIEEGGYEKDRCLFFVDRDYDDLFGDPVVHDGSTYCTDNYAIENELVCEYATNVIICDFAGFTDADPEADMVRRSVASGLRNGVQALQPFLAWSLALRSCGTNPNFNNVDLRQVLVVTAVGDVRKKRGAFARYRRACAGGSAPPSLGEVRRWHRVLSGSAPKTWVRGKFELWLFETALTAALEQATIDAKARGKARVRVPVALRQRRMFEMLGGRLPPPATLRQFLDDKLVGGAAGVG